MRQALPVLVVITLHVLCTSESVRINELNVPRLVLNGTSHVLLYCDYSVTPFEDGLVVRWFLNTNPEPIYQWIPNQIPRGLGVLRGRVEPGAGAISTPTGHRALYIRTPTTELSGDWKCFVSTFDSEDFMTKRMVVFAPESQFEVTATRLVSDGTTNITCTAKEVYPEPRLALYWDRGPDFSRKPLTGVTIETQARPSDYDITAWALVQTSDTFELGTRVVTCVLRVPAANYSRSQSLDILSGCASSLPTPRYYFLIGNSLLLQLIVASSLPNN